MTVAQYLSERGRIAGSAKSEAKRAACAANLIHARAAKLAKRATLTPGCNHTTAPKQTQPGAS